MSGDCFETCQGHSVGDGVTSGGTVHHMSDPYRSTASAPGPRFRDQLAEVAVIAAGCVRDEGNGTPFCATHDEDGNPPWHRCRWVAALDRLAPLVAAEVEARVQTAAGQQAAELRRVEALATTWECFGSRYTLTAGLAAEELRAALARPAPQEPT